MTIAFASGWQRFIEAFGIVPDRWTEHAPSPFQPLWTRVRSADRAGRSARGGARLSEQGVQVGRRHRDLADRDAEVGDGVLDGVGDGGGAGDGAALADALDAERS